MTRQETKEFKLMVGRLMLWMEDANRRLAELEGRGQGSKANEVVRGRIPSQKLGEPLWVDPKWPGF